MTSSSSRNDAVGSATVSVALAGVPPASRMPWMIHHSVSIRTVPRFSAGRRKQRSRRPRSPNATAWLRLSRNDAAGEKAQPHPDPLHDHESKREPPHPGPLLHKCVEEREMERRARVPGIHAQILFRGKLSSRRGNRMALYWEKSLRCRPARGLEKLHLSDDPHRERDLLTPALSSTSVWRRGRWRDACGFMGSMREFCLGILTISLTPALSPRRGRNFSSHRAGRLGRDWLRLGMQFPRRIYHVKNRRNRSLAKRLVSGKSA
jgi:hypothetical protein